MWPGTPPSTTCWPTRSSTSWATSWSPTVSGRRRTRYFTAANKISSGLESKLLVQNGSQAWFIEGLGDSVQSLDADALGVLYLASKSETTNAQKVLSYTNSAFAVSGRSIAKSTSTDTYNDTYAAPGPFSGFKPFIGTGAPDVMWTEGSAEMVLSDMAVGQSSTALEHVAAGDRGPDPDLRPPHGRPYGHQRHLQRRVPRVAVGRRGAWLMLATAHPTLFPSQS